MKIALLPLQRYGVFILLAVIFLPPLQRFLTSFMTIGKLAIMPLLEGACQCRLSGLQF